MVQRISLATGLSILAFPALIPLPITLLLAAVSISCGIVALYRHSEHRGYAQVGICSAVFGLAWSFFNAYVPYTVEKMVAESIKHSQAKDISTTSEPLPSTIKAGEVLTLDEVGPAYDEIDLRLMKIKNDIAADGFSRPRPRVLFQRLRELQHLRDECMSLISEYNKSNQKLLEASKGREFSSLEKTKARLTMKRMSMEHNRLITIDEVVKETMDALEKDI